MPTTGPNFPTAATGNTNVIGGGSIAWVNPTNIEANDGAFAANVITAAAVSDDLIGTAFGFAISSTATINGILLEVNYKTTIAGGTTVENEVFILKNGVPQANRSTGATLPTVATTISYGGSSDLWGTTWLPSDINNVNFGALTNYTSTLGRTVDVDFFRITIFSTSAPLGVSQMFKMF